jgi:outer membrane protein TolC
MTALSLNQYNLKRYKSAALPSLIAVAAFGYNFGEDKFDNMFKFGSYAKNALVGLQLNVPIFSGLKRVNQVRETKYNIEKSQNNIENMKQVLDFQTTQSKTSLKNALLQLQSQKRNVELAEDVLSLAQKKYKAGVGSNTEVTQAQTEQLRAQNTYFSTLLDIINAEADLKKALGLL